MLQAATAWYILSIRTLPMIYIGLTIVCLNSLFKLPDCLYTLKPSQDFIAVYCMHHMCLPLALSPPRLFLAVVALFTQKLADPGCMQNRPNLAHCRKHRSLIDLVIRLSQLVLSGLSMSYFMLLRDIVQHVATDK